MKFINYNNKFQKHIYNQIKTKIIIKYNNNYKKNRKFLNNNYSNQTNRMIY